MKKWFFNLTNKQRKSVHFISIISLFALMFTLIISPLFVFIWLVILALEITFVCFSISIKVKSIKDNIKKKSATKQADSKKVEIKIVADEKKPEEANHNEVETVNPIVDDLINNEKNVQAVSAFEEKEDEIYPNTAEIIETVEEVVETTADISLPEFVDGDDSNDVLRLKYSYKENLCFCDNFSSFDLKDMSVEFRLEPENKYDPNTVAVYSKGKKIGLMFKGNARDIVISCLQNNRFEMLAFVCQKDEANKKISILLGFYEPLDTKKSISASITKTSKIDDATGEKRYEVLEFLSEGDTLTLEESYSSDGLVVLDDSGFEVGELSESVSEKIKSRCDDLNELYVKVSEISYTDSMKVKAKVRIYFL